MCFLLWVRSVGLAALDGLDDEDLVAVLELVAGPLCRLDDLFVDGDGEVLVLGEC